MKKIRIVVVHQFTLIREALISLLHQRNEFRVIGNTATAEEAIPIILDECADVLLLEADLQDPNHIDIVRDLLEKCPDTRILILAGDLEPSMCRTAIQMGVAGVFLQNQNCKSLYKAVEKVSAGEVWMDRVMIASALADIRQHNAENAAGSGVSSLTHRELEIIELVCEGMRNQEIADRLFISEKTVRNHLASIFSKLDVSHRLELALFAKKHHITSKGSPGMWH